jgi:hypothetical protein
MADKNGKEQFRVADGRQSLAKKPDAKGLMGYFSGTGPKIGIIILIIILMLCVGVYKIAGKVHGTANKVEAGRGGNVSSLSAVQTPAPEIITKRIQLSSEIQWFDKPADMAGHYEVSETAIIKIYVNNDPGVIRKGNVHVDYPENVWRIGFQLVEGSHPATLTFILRKG